MYNLKKEKGSSFLISEISSNFKSNILKFLNSNVMRILSTSLKRCCKPEHSQRSRVIFPYIANRSHATVIVLHVSTTCYTHTGRQTFPFFHASLSLSPHLGRFTWRTTEWSDCRIDLLLSQQDRRRSNLTGLCGGGLQTREVYCVQANAELLQYLSDLREKDKGGEAQTST